MTHITTIAIPLVAEATISAFEETLASVLEYRTEACEILVLQTVPYSDPWNTSEDGVEFLSAPRKTSLSSLLNLAMMRSRGEIVLLLQAGMELNRRSLVTAAEAFEYNETLGWLVPAIISPDNEHQIQSLGNFYRKRDGAFLTFRRSEIAREENNAITLVPHQSAGYFRRRAWETVGGLAGDLSLPISYADLVLRMEQLSWTGELCTAAAVVALHPKREKILSAFAQGCEMERLFQIWRNNTNVSFGKHLQMVQKEFLSAFPQPRAALTLCGRLLALLTKRVTATTLNEFVAETVVLAAQIESVSATRDAA